jgi:hypothetical protein
MTTFQGPGYWRHMFLQAANELNKYKPAHEISTHSWLRSLSNDYLSVVELGDPCEDCTFEIKDDSPRYPYTKMGNTWLYVCYICSHKWTCNWDYELVPKAYKVPSLKTPDSRSL